MGEVEGGLEVLTSDGKRGKGAVRVHRGLKGAKRGVIISVCVGYELWEDDTCSTKELSIPASPVY